MRTIKSSVTDNLVDFIGHSIAHGSWGPGSVIDLDALMEEHDVSRTALREAVRVLRAKNLLAARPNVGTWILGTEQWNLLDPELLGWLRGTSMGEQLAQDASSFAELLRSKPEMAANPFVAQALAAVTDFNLSGDPQHSQVGSHVL